MKQKPGEQCDEDVIDKENNSSVGTKGSKKKKAVYGVIQKKYYEGSLDSRSSDILKRAGELSDSAEREELYKSCRPAIMALIRFG